MVHNDYYMPYPFDLDIVTCDHIAFCWDEYCQKVGKPDECVGDLACSTYQGKPAVPPPTGDTEMSDATGPQASTTPPSFAAASGGKGVMGWQSFADNFL